MITTFGYMISNPLPKTLRFYNMWVRVLLKRTQGRSSCRSSRKQWAYRAPLAELAKEPGIRRCFSRRRRKWICTSSMWRICCLSIRMRKRIQLLLISTTSFCCIICFLIFLFATFLPPHLFYIDLSYLLCICFFSPPVFPSAFSVFSDAFRSFLPRIFFRQCSNS